MLDAIAVAAGLAFLLVVWLSVVQTVLTPRQRPPRAVRWPLRAAASVAVALSARLSSRWRRRIMALCAPAALSATFALWLAGVGAGFGLLGHGLGDVPLTGAGLGRYLTLRAGWPADVLGLLSWLAIALLLSAFTVYLMRVVDAYGRRELLIARLSAQSARPADAERVIANYVGTDSRAQLDALFAEWTGWLADIRGSHVSDPALAYLRPSSELCWLDASVMVLDAAALVDATAPGWAPLHTRALLDTGARCFERLASALGIVVPSVGVSLHGREQRGFAETIQMSITAGLPVERTDGEAWTAFQQARTRYAPFAAAIAARLLYRLEECRFERHANADPVEAS